MQFGARVRYLREKHGWTQDQLATRAEMRRATIVKWENGQDNPKLDNIQKIAKKGFGISISKLLEGVGGS